MVGSNILNISFEIGNNRSLVFENNFNNYQLKPTNCKIVKRTSTTLNTNSGKGQPLTQQVVKNVNECTLNYEGKVYQTELSVMPKLLIKKRQINKNKTSVRTAKGVKVN
jgi:ubiquitin C-terminal hydrolase